VKDEMTITAARVADIIDACGGDASRWPEAERDAALALVALNPALQAAQRDASGLDTLLAGWATAPVTPVRDAAAAAALARRPRTTWLRWVAGTGMAATIAATLVATLALQPATTPSPVTPQPQIAAAAPIKVSDEAAFAMLFTPTPEEEDLI
jgi:hypothetical protein